VPYIELAVSASHTCALQMFPLCMIICALQQRSRPYNVLHSWLSDMVMTYGVVQISNCCTVVRTIACIVLRYIFPCVLIYTATATLRYCCSKGPSAVRRAELRASYYFDCDCARCHAAEREDSQLNAVVCTAPTCTGGLCLPTTAAATAAARTACSSTATSSSDSAASTSTDAVAQQQQELFRQWSCMQSTVKQPSDAVPHAATAAGSADEATAYVCDR
jgi:hypothetical protein